MAAAVFAAKKWRELTEEPGTTGSAARLAESLAGDLAKRAGDAGKVGLQKATAGAREFVTEFKRARAERETELAVSLLAESQGSVDELRARRAAARAAADGGTGWGGDAARTPTNPAPTPTSPAPTRNQKSAANANGGPDPFAGDEEHVGYEF
ncbi:hypothetical protein [Rarobacter incanus]|uniref:hypothetical protein n=1 Tax=Rarobacter incanus TaxID=153494 RepID=UPI00114DD094|nr:hypothetical protein [Rarobacter incanus]